MINYWTEKESHHTAAIQRLRAERDSSEGEAKDKAKQQLAFHGGELRIANTALETFKR